MCDGVYAYQYNAEGNRIRRTHLASGAVTEYAWDARNRLVTVTQRATAEGPATQVVHYLYDMYNRWIGESIDSNGDGQIDHQIRFVYDGQQIVLQFEASSPLPLAGEGQGEGGENESPALQLTHRYLWSTSVDQLLADEQIPAAAQGEGGTITTAGTVLWALTDHLGTVRDLVQYNATSGQTVVVNHRVYDAFGNLESQTNASAECLFGFTGRPSDQASGLQNNLNRWYDPASGRWTSEDPVGVTAGDANTRRYVGNSPANAADPTGLDFIILRMDGTRIQHERFQQPPLIQYKDSSVDWVVRGSNRVVRIGTATAEYREERIPYAPLQGQELTTFTAIQLSPTFGGQRVSLPTLRLAASAVQSVLGDSGMTNDPPTVQDTLIKTMIELAASGVLNDVAAPAGAAALAWLVAHEGDLEYGPPPKSAEVTTKAAALRESTDHYFPVERGFKAAAFDVLNATFNGVRIVEPGASQTSTGADFEANVPDLRRNGRVSGFTKVIELRQERLNDAMSKSAARNQMLTNGGHAVAATSSATMHVKVQNGTAYFWFRTKNGRLVPRADTPKVDGIDPTNMSTEITLNAATILRSWLGYKGDLGFLEKK